MASTKTVKPDGGGDYPSLQDWEDWADGESGENIAEVYGGTGHAGAVHVAGGSGTPIIRAASGEGFDSLDPSDNTAVARIETTGVKAVSFARFGPTNPQMYGMWIKVTLDSLSNYKCVEQLESGTSEIHDCGLYVTGTGTGTTTNIDGFALSSLAGTAHWWNNYVYCDATITFGSRNFLAFNDQNGGGTGHVKANLLAVFAGTVTSGGAYGYVGKSDTYWDNCVGLDWNNDDFNFGNTGSEKCISSDGTVSTWTNCYANVTDTDEFVSPSTLDFTPKSGGNAIDNGVAQAGFSTDIFGTSHDASIDIGPVEAVTTATEVTPSPVTSSLTVVAAGLSMATPAQTPVGLTLSVVAPTLSMATPSQTPVALSLSVVSPSLSLVTPAQTPLTMSLSVVEPAAGVSTSPSAVGATLTVVAPTLSMSQTPDPVTATLTVIVPSVATTFVLPSPVTMSLLVIDPVVHVEIDSVRCYYLNDIVGGGQAYEDPADIITDVTYADCGECLDATTGTAACGFTDLAEGPASVKMTLSNFSGHMSNTYGDKGLKALEIGDSPTLCTIPATVEWDGEINRMGGSGSISYYCAWGLNTASEFSISNFYLPQSAVSIQQCGFHTGVGAWIAWLHLRYELPRLGSCQTANVYWIKKEGTAPYGLYTPTTYAEAVTIGGVFINTVHPLNGTITIGSP